MHKWPVSRNFDVDFIEQAFQPTMEGYVICDEMTLMWCHCNKQYPYFSHEHIYICEYQVQPYYW